VTYRPLPVRLSGYPRLRRRSSAKRQACIVLLALSVGALAAAPALGDTIGSKRAQARRVLGEIHQLDVQLEKSAEAYDLANVKLAHIQAQISTNRFELRVARHNYKRAQQLLAARLRAIYLSGGVSDNSTLEILLGSRSLDDVLNSFDAVNRVSSADTSILHQVRTFRTDARRRSALLKRANSAQRQVVAERAAEKASVERSLAERQQLVASIKGEIARLQAEELARQARLQREAAARFAVQQAQEREAIQRTVVGPSALTPEGVGVAPPSQYGGVVGIAMQYLGTPYVWGGGSPGGFDCSGFVMFVYSQMGVSLPHNAAAQFGYGVPVSQDQLEPGDLVFFDGLGHVGIYIGGGQFIHSPHTGDVVKISSLGVSWYAATYVGARRIT
jgi:cell wall-associated NlpC family hydrolase